MQKIKENKEIVYMFVTQAGTAGYQHPNSSLTIDSHDRALYSYQAKIGEYKTGEGLTIFDEKISATTSRHISLLKKTMDVLGYLYTLEN